jgi:predicted metalloendopeptidase
MTSWKTIPRAALAALAMTAAASAGEAGEAPAGGPAKQAAAAVADPIAAELLSALDKTADPCHDFYRYACGGWLDKTTLPGDQTRWVRSFSVIREENRAELRAILEDAAANPGTDPDRRRIGWYYGSCMDQEAIEKAGTRPLEPILAEIAKVEGAEGAMKVTGMLHRWNAGPLFGVGVLPDFKNPGTNIGFMIQGGLGMPDRDYYVSDDEDKKRLLAAYREHLARVFGMLGASPEAAAADAGRVLAFETALAAASRPRQDLRLPEKLYNKIDRKGLEELTPSLPWGAYFTALGHPGVTQINVATPEFFTALAERVAASEPADLRAYLTWHAVDALSDALPERFVEARYDFFGETLSGQKEIEPRWKRCVGATENALGEAVGKLYVERRFAGDSKAKALEMIADLERAFESNLPELAWMDETTRGRALDKLAAIGDKVGYPDQWRDYSAMPLAAGDYFANHLAGSAFETDRQVSQVGGPVDRGEWRMTPQTVNASYNPLLNEISFPAGILQPPMFHRDFPAAMNYGAIGAVVGHEITHGFDDQGRKFDPRGELREWWEPAVAASFETRAQCVDDFYSGLEVEPGVHVNGRLTLGENIADIGGVKQAYEAYRIRQSRHGEPEEAAVPGLSDEQLFFVAYAQVWCGVATPEEERLRITTDPHSPPQFRVRGTLANVPQFARAFSCAEGTPMNPAERCEVW